MSESRVSTNPTHHNVEVILNDQTEWPYFIQNVRAQAQDHGIWDQVNPENTTQPELTIKPQRPKPSDLQVESIANLKGESLAIYKSLQEDYKFEHGEWKQQESAMIAIHQYIREHITLPNHDAISESKSVWDTLRKLQDRCQLSDEAKLLDLKIRWNRLVNMETKNQEWKVIVDNVSNLYTKLVKEKIVTYKADGVTPSDKLQLIEVINLLARIDRTYADSKRANLKDPNYYIKDVPGLIKDFREYFNTKVFRKSQGIESFAFNTESQEPTFQGQGRRNCNHNNNSNSRQICPCGNDHIHHRPAKCYYIGAKEKAPSDWNPSHEKTEKVAKAMKDPKVRAFIKEDRDNYLEAVKKSQQNQHGSKPSQSESASSQASGEVDGEDEDLYHTTIHDEASENDLSEQPQTTVDEDNYSKDLTKTHQTSEVVTSFSTASEPEPYYFTNAWVLDGGSERHVCNSPLRNNYTKTRDAPPGSFVQCGLTRYRIDSYGTCILKANRPDGSIANVTITEVALCPYFRTNLLSTSKLEKKGLHLITLNGGYMCPGHDVTKKKYIPIKHRMYWCLEFSPPTHHPYAMDPRESETLATQANTLSKKELERKKLLTTKASEQVVDQEIFKEDPVEDSAEKETVSTSLQSARSTTPPPDSEEDTINRTSSRGGTAEIRSPSPATSIAQSSTPELWNSSFHAFITSKKQHRNDLSPKPIPLKWVFDYKCDSSGFLTRLKARICVKGDKQPLNGLDTYAATLAAEAMRFLLAIAAHFDLKMRQNDAVTAFLNAHLDETVHTTSPPGFWERGQIWPP
jgi:hypothetical protein